MNKTKKKINPFDTLVEKFAAEFIKVPDFDLLEKDNAGRRMFNILIFRLADLASYKDLVVNYYVPATNKAIVDSEQMMIHSKFKAFLEYKKEDLYDTLYQTIRLAYVGVFHKLESFMNDILKMSQILYEDQDHSETLEKFAKRVFDFQFRDWQQFDVTGKINWVCNCVKHYDGFPLKEPKPAVFAYFPTDQRLAIPKDEFKRDVETLIEFTNVYLQLMFMIAHYKTLTELYDPERWKDDPELQQKQEAGFKDVFDKIKNFIAVIKN